MRIKTPQGKRSGAVADTTLSEELKQEGSAHDANLATKYPNSKQQQ